MKTATTHHAKTHLSKLLKDVQAGETIVILNGKTPAAQLMPVENIPSRRPQVGTVTSGPVEWDADTFAPLDDAGLQEWGL